MNAAGVAVTCRERRQHARITASLDAARFAIGRARAGIDPQKGIVRIDDQAERLGAGDGRPRRRAVADAEIERTPGRQADVDSAGVRRECNEAVQLRRIQATEWCCDSDDSSKNSLLGARRSSGAQGLTLIDETIFMLSRTASVSLAHAHERARRSRSGRQ